MSKPLAVICTAAALMLVGLPFTGIWLAGYPLSRYLEFPPQTRYVEHADFSPVVFTGYALFVACCGFLLIRQMMRTTTKDSAPRSTLHPFPGWGWLGLGSGLIFWCLAWTRFPWFAALQPHTFTPLWLSFILVINALTQRRTGSCILRKAPLFFMALFPASAVFWWFFEYLNRFVQNWTYSGARYGPLEYFIYATLSFSTVLPAVQSVQEWLSTFPRLSGANPIFPDPLWPAARRAAVVVLGLSGVGLLLIGVWPDSLFALVWVSPLLIAVCLQILSAGSAALENLRRGGRQIFVSYALAALFCGFFWEMWNFYSLAKWQYRIPFVHRFLLFEMPILGYAGYIPFGWACMVIIAALKPGKLPGGADKPARQSD